MSETKSIFTWIHLSDIHFGQGDEWDHEKARQIFEALRDRAKHDVRVSLHPKPDAILVTGDIAHDGSELAYSRYALPVLRRLGKDHDISDSRILVVPGNHDIELGPTGSPGVSDLWQSLREDARTLDAAALDTAYAHLLKVPLSTYRKWMSRLSKRHNKDGWACKLVDSNAVCVVAVGLNTATGALGGGADKGKLQLGLKQLRALRRNKKNIVVVMAHHPPDWLCARDAENLTSQLASCADFVLFGHEHSPDIHAIQSIGSTVYVHAGAVNQERSAIRRPTYNVGAIFQDGHVLKARFWPKVLRDKGDFDFVPHTELIDADDGQATRPFVVRQDPSTASTVASPNGPVRHCAPASQEERALLKENLKSILLHAVDGGSLEGTQHVQHATELLDEIWATCAKKEDFWLKAYRLDGEMLRAEYASTNTPDELRLRDVPLGTGAVGQFVRDVTKRVKSVGNPETVAYYGLSDIEQGLDADALGLVRKYDVQHVLAAPILACRWRWNAQQRRDLLEPIREPGAGYTVLGYLCYCAKGNESELDTEHQKEGIKSFARILGCYLKFLWGGHGFSTRTA